MDVESLTSFNILIFSNLDPDVRSMVLKDTSDLQKCISFIFPNSKNVSQMILPNPDQNGMCTHFMVMADQFHIKSPTNFRLETFLKGVGLHSVQARCLRALVVGMCGGIGDNYVTIPDSYLFLHPRTYDPLSPIDVYCSDINQICGIQGTFLPYQLPDELQWNILKYMRHPCAEIISSEMKRINDYWDLHFNSLFCIWNSEQVWSSAVHSYVAL